MAHQLDPHRIYTDDEYRAARGELADLLGMGVDMSGDHRVDELLEVIENYEAAVRFIPDWSGESFAHAA